MKKTDVVEETKLRWPDGCERTRIKERIAQGRWKETWTETKQRLVLELERMGATSILISRHDNELQDTGVAVWFSMKKEDFSWQQILGLDNPAPLKEEIDVAFRERVKKCHPDGPQPDPALYHKLSEARQRATAWITGTHGHSHEHVMAIDQYNEARLNLKALQMAFFYIRRLEDVGAPAILAQTLNAFRAKLVASVGGAA